MIEEPPFDLLCPGRRPTGIGPVLVPADPDGGVDWNGFAHMLGRVADTRLLVGVNTWTSPSTTGDPKVRAEVLATAGAALGGETFVAGVAAPAGEDGTLDPEGLAGAVHEVVRHGAVPLLLRSPALAALRDDELLGLVAWAGDWCDRLLVAESPPAPSTEGSPWGLDVFGALMSMHHCIGVVHGSRRRAPEWDRIRSRDETRPDFHVFSSNDRAVDQIVFGADHRLDISAVVPDLVQARDDAWEAEDPDAMERDDALQALSSLVSREPVTALPHALARVALLRGWLSHDRVIGAIGARPSSDDELLRAALDRLGA